MKISLSTSIKAQRATTLVEGLQAKFVKVLTSASEGEIFEEVSWLRDQGVHGGGSRFVAPAKGFFDRASVNVSHVHYDDVPEKKLASASALSAIVHPSHPFLPSIHIHFSWTEMRDGSGYWRMMADLNPSNPNDQNTIAFDENLKAHSAEYFEEGKRQGDEYFFIPALKEHRGVSHFYLEGFDTGDFDKDYAMAEVLACSVIDTYQQIIISSLSANPEYSAADKQRQIDYHTLYFYQVLTLDKGTTAGILVHNQNDLGVFGSLPSTINCDLLKSWIERTPEPLNDLVKDLFEVFNATGNAKVENNEKLAFAKIIRAFYADHSNLLTFRN